LISELLWQSLIQGRLSILVEKREIPGLDEGSVSEKRPEGVEILEPDSATFITDSYIDDFGAALRRLSFVCTLGLMDPEAFFSEQFQQEISMARDATADVKLVSTPAGDVLCLHSYFLMGDLTLTEFDHMIGLFFREKALRTQGLRNAAGQLQKFEVKRKSNLTNWAEEVYEVLYQLRATAIPRFSFESS
jgi:hypothetical protein